MEQRDGSEVGARSRHTWRDHGIHRRALMLAAALVLAGNARAASSYFVDGSNPACTDAGPGTAAIPYCTISAAVAAHGGPGVTVLVKPGIYREQVHVTASGAAGAPFVLRAQAAGVIVDGADDFSSAAAWAAQGGGVHLAAGVTWAPVQVLVDGVRLTPSTDPVATLPAATFEYVAGSGLYVNLGGANPGTHQTFVGRRASGFVIEGQTRVRLEGFTVTRSDDKAIHVQSGSTLDTLTGNVVTLAASAGIGIEGGSQLLISGNRVSQCSHHGISLRLGSQGCVIQDNECFANQRGTTPWPNGIYLSESPGNVLQRNNVHHNQDTGLEIQTGSNNCVSLQNVSWSNGDHGFEHLFATGTIDIGNVAWGNHTDGFSVEGQATGTTLVDCIAAENGIGIGEFNLFVDAGSVTGFTSHDNVFWNASAQSPVKYNGIVYGTLADYRTATGQDVRSLEADPRFVSPATGDFHLLANSPCIDAASSLLALWPALDADGHTRSDDPSIPNTGVGPVVYADRGAFEFHSSTAGVISVHVSAAPALSDVAPNPSHGRVSFTVQPANEEPVQWSIVDLAGRELLGSRGPGGAGRLSLRWDGRDPAGRAAPPGIYMVVARSGQSMTSKRFVIIR